jgi:hypothetical protein
LITPADITDLPSNWIKDLHEAAVRGRPKLVLQLANEIEQDHGHLTEILNHLVHTFYVEKIVALLDRMSVNDADKETEYE